jgi:hypothetical protein
MGILAPSADRYPKSVRSDSNTLSIGLVCDLVVRVSTLDSLNNFQAPGPGFIPPLSKGFILAIDRRTNGADTPTFIATKGSNASAG